MQLTYDYIKMKTCQGLEFILSILKLVELQLDIKSILHLLQPMKYIY